MKTKQYKILIISYITIVFIVLSAITLVLNGIFDKNISKYGSSGVKNEAVYPPLEVIGVINPDVNQENIHSTICVAGYTKTIRPPTSYTNKLKIEQIRKYGYIDKDPSHYEEDHLISLVLGGHPTDPRNLFPQNKLSKPYNAYTKDHFEVFLAKKVCDGSIKLADAQKYISKDWLVNYLSMVSDVLDQSKLGSSNDLSSLDEDDE